MTNTINIRNIGIVAHVDAGKTTITEHMLYRSGEIRSIGSVDKGTAHTDWLDVERQRGISVKAASTSFKWSGTEINLIDTPGHVDFSAEVERSLRVLDGAVLVVSSVEGIQAQTEILWKALKDMEIPTIFFVNKIDRVGSNSQQVLQELKRQFTPYVVPLQKVINEGSGGCAVRDIIDDNLNEIINASNEHLVEFLADFDEILLEKYVNGCPTQLSELREKLISLVHKAYACPVLFGSALNDIGIANLMDAVVTYLPSPEGDEEKPVSGLVFKIEHDKTMGRIAHVRLYNGSLKNRDVITNATQDKEEKVTQIRKVFSNRYEDVGLLRAGDIAGVCGLSISQIGDILGSGEGVPSEHRLANPLLKVQVYAEKETDYPQLVAALQELSDEDPLLELQWLQNERELHVHIMGIIQLEILTSILKSRFDLDVTFGKPSVIYKETPSKPGEGFAAYTMPKPCWAIIRLLIEPGLPGSGVQFSTQVRDEKIAVRYQNQIEKTLPRALKQGIYGWEVIDLKVTLIGGEHHIFHTHPLDFVVATPMAIMDGLVNTGTTLLEPMLQFHITVPEEIGGRVIGDIVQMRGSFDSPVISKGLFTVEGKMPAATSLDYPIKLGSISGGRGVISTKFAAYQECPLELGATCERRGINPLDHSKYILSVRSALSSELSFN